LRQITDTIARRREREQWEQLKILEWQTRQLAGFAAASAGVMGDTSELVQAAGQLSITGDGEDVPAVPAPVRPRTGLEEWQQAARTQDSPEEVQGVPAGMRFDDLPEMQGVPVGGPQRTAAEAAQGAGRMIGSAEALIGVLERGEVPQGR